MKSDMLLDEAMQGALPDIRIQIVFYIFCVNAVFAMGCMFFGAVPYYHYFGENETRIGLWTSLACLVVAFITMTFLVWRKLHINVAILASLVLWISTIELVGFASATLVNIAPIQFMAIVFLQSISIVAYTRFSPRLVSMQIVIAVQIVATIVAWALSIYGFIVEADWIGGGVLLLLSAASIAYNVRAIYATEDRYDASFEQGVNAILDFYCGWAVEGIKHLIK